MLEGEMKARSEKSPFCGTLLLLFSGYTAQKQCAR